MGRPEKIRLGDLLIQQGLLTDEQLTRSLDEQKRSGRKLGRIVVEQGYVTEEAIARALARQLQTVFVDLKSFNPRKELINRLPEAQARRFRAVVLDEIEGRLRVGFADPTDLHAAHSIYFQVLGEHGWFGLLLFMGIGFFAFRDAARVRKQAQHRVESQWLVHLCGMLQVSMVGFAVGGAFLSLAYFDLPYNIMVMVVACRWWLKEERWKLETTGAFGSAAPVARLKPQDQALKAA